MRLGGMALEQVLVTKLNPTSTFGAYEVALLKVGNIDVISECFFLTAAIRFSIVPMSEYKASLHTDLKSLVQSSIVHFQSLPTSPPLRLFADLVSSAPLSSTSASCSPSR